MGTMAAFYLIYVCLIIISPFLGGCRKSCKCANKASQKLNKSIYWGTLITLMNESYMIIAVCLLLNMNILSTESPGLKVMSILCAIFLGCAIIIPIIIISYLRNKFDQLKTDEMKNAFGALYADLNLKEGRKVLLGPTFFLARRMMLAIAICTVGKVLIWQIFIMSTLIIAQVILIGTNIFTEKTKRRLEFFNELILMTTMYTILVYSAWNDDAILKFQVGYVTIFIVACHLAVNLTLIFGTTAISIRKKCRVKNAKRRFKKSRTAIQARLAKGHAARKKRMKKLRDVSKLSLQPG